MVVCVECLPADKPWDVVSVRHARALAWRRRPVPVCASCTRVCWWLVPPNLYLYIHTSASHDGAPTPTPHQSLPNRNLVSLNPHPYKAFSHRVRYFLPLLPPPPLATAIASLLPHPVSP